MDHGLGASFISEPIQHQRHVQGTQVMPSSRLEDYYDDTDSLATAYDNVDEENAEDEQLSQNLSEEVEKQPNRGLLELVPVINEGQLQMVVSGTERYQEPKTKMNLNVTAKQDVVTSLQNYAVRQKDFSPDSDSSVAGPLSG